MDFEHWIPKYICEVSVIHLFSLDETELIMYIS